MNNHQKAIQEDLLLLREEVVNEFAKMEDGELVDDVEKGIWALFEFGPELVVGAKELLVEVGHRSEACSAVEKVKLLVPLLIFYLGLCPLCRWWLIFGLI